MTVSSFIKVVEQKVSEAKKVLKKHNIEVNVTPEDLISYFQATTFEKNTTTLDDVLKNPFLLIHELVEINELKQRGLRITKNVIIKNVDTVYEAHLIATDVELTVAYEAKALQYLKNRRRDIESWLEDPLLPQRLYSRCEDLLQKVKKWSNSLADV